MLLDYITEGTPEFVKSLFPESFKGMCVDIGAYHPTWFSNSWIVEKDDWDTYCIEPNKYCLPLLIEHRLKVFNYAIDNKNDDNAQLFIYGKNTPNNSFGPDGMAAATGLIWGGGSGEEANDEIQIVRAMTLDTFVKENNIDHIDYLSIDTEGKEFDILKSSDLINLKVKVVVTESLTLEKHLKQKELLNSLGYYWIKRFAVNDIYVRQNTHTEENIIW